MTAGQYRVVRAAVRRGEHVASDPVAQVRAVATAMRLRGRSGASQVLLAVVCTAQAPLVPSWAAAVAVVAGVGNLVLAVVIISDWRRARRFVAAHPSIEMVAR